jgi:UDP-N-acetylmuramoyl-tripeptide--D-alanyl-D-alanine ligase
MKDTDMMMTLAQAAELLPGARLVGDPATPLRRVHTDTRTLQPGDLFVALKGERFDAHDFLPQAQAAGAVAALAERGLAEAGLAGLEVPDSLLGLQQLAAGWRERHALPLIAVTGSNGKTTVTQMIATILRVWQGEAALATQGNLNNHIGVPLTLLRLRGAHRVAVIELGMNHPGEIAELARIAQPTVALVNNAQREHQEFMGTVEAVALENGQVIAALPVDGVAVFPSDDTYTSLWRELAGARRVLDFALDTAQSALHLDAIWALDHWQATLHTPAGAVELALRLAGRHNLKNALAAAACALAAGCPIEAVRAGLQAFQPVSGRSQLEHGQWQGRPVTLINDSYNANPDSVRAAIDVLAELPGPRWLLLGDMGEVGDQGPAFHTEVGLYAAERGIDRLWTAGTLAAHAAAAYRDRIGANAAVRHHAHTTELVAALMDNNLAPDGPALVSVLVKGSRFMKMEQAVAVLRTAAHPAQAGGAAC